MSLNISDSDWRDFEKLIFRLLLDEYGIEENKINRLTQAKKDGGYDGIFYIPCPQGENNHVQAFIRTLFEAKLRNDLGHSLPLQEFSKALIISINKNANRLIIATNLYFSQGTIVELQKYSKYTGLEIRFLTSYDIHQWLENRGVSFAQSFITSSNLIGFLQESYQRNQSRAQESSQKSIYHFQPVFCHTEIIGCDRKRALSESLSVFRQFPGIITVEGEVGIGKSVFTNQVLRELQENENYNVQKVDIEYCSTPRVLFLELLDHIWHIPFQILNTFDEETSQDILRWIGDWEVPEEMRRTLLVAFSKSANEYHNSSDLFNYYLTEYIYKIYNIVKQRKPPVLCLTNINYADEDLLKFLLQLLKKFDGTTRILLELRTSLYINNRVTDQDWADFLSTVWQLPSLRKRVYLKEWDPEDSISFIRSRMNPLPISLHCTKIIQRRVGKNPLHLDTFLDYLSLRTKNENIPEAYWEEYIANCPLENINHTIFLLIDRLARTLRHAGEILFVLGILGGHSSEFFITLCIGEAVAETLDYICTETSLLKKQGEEICVSHSLYLAAIQKYDYLSSFSKQRLAAGVYEYLDEAGLDSFRRAVACIELLKTLGEQKKSAECAFNLAETLFKDGQFQASSRYYTEARVFLETIDGIDEALLFRCMLGQIKCRLHLEEFTAESIQRDIDNCKEALDHCAVSEELAREYLIDYLIAKNQFLHYFGKFQESLHEVGNILSLLYRCECPNVELIGAMWAEYAIAVKETSSLENALETFRRAVRICPGSRNLQFAHLTHLSEKCSSFDPRQAQDYLLKIRELEVHLNLSDRMHNWVNLATIWFYCGDSAQAYAEGKRLIREAYTLGLSNEEGRLSNLLGCIALYDGRQQEALSYFLHGLDIFKEENYVAYLWPLLVNLSTLYFWQGQDQEAFRSIRQCTDIFRSSYLQRIRQTPRPERSYEKLHIAIILLAGTLHELHLPEEQTQLLLDELHALAKDSVIMDIISLAVSREKAIELASGSTFCLNGEVYIKD